MTIKSDKGESLSSFVEGELSGDQCETLISTICKDEDMKSFLERYHIISDSMKSQLPDGIKSDFVNCVMSAIESEPTAFSTTAPTPLKPTANNKLGLSSSSAKTSFTKRVAGFAIAASVATLAVMVVQTKNQEDPQQIVKMPQNSEFVRLAKDNPVTAGMQSVVTPAARSGFSNAS